MKAGVTLFGADRYVAGELERFDQKNETLKRARWDPAVKHLGDRLYNFIVTDEGRAGYTLEDQAFLRAAGAVSDNFGYKIAGGGEGLYSWQDSFVDPRIRTDGFRIKVDSSLVIAKKIKKAAKLLGASLTGICQIDNRWIYSHSYDSDTGEHKPIEIPEEYKYAVVMAFEMDYESLKYTPTFLGESATEMGYSQMAFTTYMVAYYIRHLGYQALPMGNDTACSVPLAIDAGLGELSRGGFLITEKFGPRVRLSKVFTDLPLVSDMPVNFGAWDFCLKCDKCAQYCSGQAIMFGEPTTEINNISNRKGLLRWPVNGEKCYNFWAANGVWCSSCIRVCPFNKLPGWLHSLTRWGVRNVRWLDPFFIKMDDLLGYGKRLKTEHFWDNTV